MSRDPNMAQGEFKMTLKNTDEIELIVTGRVSGRKTSRPVWFVQEVDTLYLLPVAGSDTEWFKNVLHNPTIILAAHGINMDGQGQTDHRSRQGWQYRRKVPRQIWCRQCEEVLLEV
jgi:F420H(2)-dependent quinone reductase